MGNAILVNKTLLQQTMDQFQKETMVKDEVTPSELSTLIDRLVEIHNKAWGTAAHGIYVVDWYSAHAPDH